MPVLAHTKHEQFAQSIAKGISATGAYISAGYSKAGAAASASRLKTNANVAARIKELKTANAANVVRVEIRKRSARIRVRQNIVDGSRHRSVLRERSRVSGRYVALRVPPSISNGNLDVVQSTTST